MFRKILSLLLVLFLLVSPLSAGGNRWTKKPPLGSQIDWGNSLSKGLVGCWLMNEGGGINVKNLVTLNNGSLETPAFFSLNGIKTDGASGDVRISRYSQLETVPLTIIFECKKTGNAESYGRIFSKTRNNANTYPWGSVWLEYNASSQTNVVPSISAADTLYQGSAISNYLVLNETIQGGMRCYKKAGTTNFDTIKNGKIIQSNDSGSTNSIGWDTSSTGDLYFGAGGAGGNAATNNIYYYFYYYNRALSSSEIQQLYQDPYCFIKPPTIWSMFSTAVAAARRRIGLVQ